MTEKKEWWTRIFDKFNCDRCNKQCDRGGFVKDEIRICWECLHK